MNTDNQAGVCTPNSHNLDVMHLGCCTTCGGNKIVPADRPSPHPSAEAVSENMDIAIKALQRIANPVKYFRDELKEGERLNGHYAIAISNDADWLKSQALTALESINATPSPDTGAIKVLDWLLRMSDAGEIDMVDGCFYYREDKDGDQPIDEKEIIALSIQYPEGFPDRPLSHAGQRLVDKQLEEGVGIYHQPLFNLMANDHGLTLLNSEMDEIIRVVIKMIEPSSESLEEKAKEAIPELKHIINSVSEARKIWEEGFLAGANYILKQQKGEL